MERLLHYVWKHRLFPPPPLYTTDGEEIEVIEVGLHNHDAGPDFFNARIRIDQQIWAGNVELHLHSADWRRHRHHTDERYNNVILHVATCVDEPVVTQSGRRIPQLRLGIPPEIAANYQKLLAEDQYPPCRNIIPQIPAMHVHAWLNALTAERLENKTERIQNWLKRTAGDWERTFFITLARAFGFGKNTDAFETWAASIDPQHIGKHRDNPFQVEAFFFGQAGLLDNDTTPPHRQDEHFRHLQTEYRFLQRKFQLTPISPRLWKFLRLRPQNFPHRRLAQLAELYAAQRICFAKVRNTHEPKEMRNLLKISSSEYWREHYSFGRKDEKETKEFDNLKCAKNSLNSENTPLSSSSMPKIPPAPRPAASVLSNATIDLLLINVFAPLLFAYGQLHQDEEMKARAFNLLETLRPEQNSIVRSWRHAGVEAEHAADSQALLHLQLHFCNRRECLHCRFGTFYLRHKNT